MKLTKISAASVPPPPPAERYLRLFERLAPLMSEENPEVVAEQAAGLISHALDVDACSLLVRVDDDYKRLRMAAATHILRVEWPKIRMSAEAGPSGAVCKSGEALLIRGEDEFREKLGRAPDARYAVPSCLIAPLRIGGETGGVINVTNPRSGEPFDERDLAMVEAVARVVGGALDRARRQSHQATLFARLQSAFDNLSVGVAELEKGERIVHHNARLTAMLELGDVDLGGRTLRQALPGMLYNVCQRMIETCRRRRQPIHERIDVEFEGRDFRLGVTVQEFASVGGDGGLLLMCQDITQEEELMRLREAEEAKQCFLGIISHELRTPLTVIKGALPLIEPFDRDNVPKETMCQVHKVISRNTHRLIDVVNSMLMVTEIENGTLALSKRGIDLGALMKKSADFFVETAQSKGATIECRIDDSMGPVLGDEARLGQILRELTFNAVKFSPRRSTVHIKASVEGDRAVIEVSNQGEPIPDEAREGIFEKFYQVDASRTRAVGGCGLGLFLASNIIRLHGGELRLLDGPEGQTVFQVRLPYETPAAQDGDV